jgi:ABC-type sugar transport system permease subunit
MLLGTFQDLTTFLAFFGMVIGTFSVMVLILIPGANELYQSHFSFVIVALRTSLGDNEISNYNDYLDGDVPSTSSLTWLVWLMIMVVGNVIFMNFIVAVVSESYEKCMQRQTIEKYRRRMQMIREKEIIMTREEWANERYFPKSLILVEPENQSE